MTTVDLERLAARGLTSSHYDAGQKIFLQEDTGGRMFVVRSGRVQIVTYGTVLENVGPGGFFGEMSLIDGAPRSAAAIALDASDVIALDRQAFLNLVREEPEFALHVMGVLANRIRKMYASM